MPELPDQLHCSGHGVRLRFRGGEHNTLCRRTSPTSWAVVVSNQPVCAVVVCTLGYTLPKQAAYGGIGLPTRPRDGIPDLLLYSVTASPSGRCYAGRTPRPRRGVQRSTNAFS